MLSSAPVAMPQGKELTTIQTKVLETLVLHYRDPSKSNRQTMLAVWGEEKHPSTLSKIVTSLRKSFGPEGNNYLLRSPFQLGKPPALISGVSDLPFSTISLNDDSSNVSNLESHPASKDSASFAMIVDGMIVNAAAELIYEDSETAAIRSLCSASYERALEDLAFSTVYASHLITSKVFRPSNTSPLQPAQQLVAELSHIFEQRAYPAHISGGVLLHDEENRQGIEKDIQRFAECVLNPRTKHFVRDYMQREAAKHLGAHDTLFQNDLDPDKYIFNVARSYYSRRSLQDALGAVATGILVSFLPKTPPRSQDRFAPNALNEFATRNVLSLITLLWEANIYAKGEGASHMPHILRAMVVEKRFRQRTLRRQQDLRDFLVGNALTAALSTLRSNRRDRLIERLLELRDERPFKEFRHLLIERELLTREESPHRENDAKALLRDMKALIATGQNDPIRFESNFVIRRGGVTAGEYESEIYRVFPELRGTGI